MSAMQHQSSSSATESSGSQEGMLVVVSGPSGVGKTTIVRALLDKLPAVFSVSATTRQPRDGEKDGVDYYFVTPEQFELMRADHEFLEYAQVFGRDWYGTPRGAVQRHLDAGRIVLLDIDVQGAFQVRKSMPESLLLFLQPPSDEQLLQRLRARGRDDEQAIQRRFSEAKREMESALRSRAYDAFIVNDDLEKAILEARARIEERRSRCPE